VSGRLSIRKHREILKILASANLIRPFGLALLMRGARRGGALRAFAQKIIETKDQYGVDQKIMMFC
jgi:hypothetical protein